MTVSGYKLVVKSNSQQNCLLNMVFARVHDQRQSHESFIQCKNVTLDRS